ncbi:MAG TPA: hypothetical protein VFQ85_10925 [Mycobacteriales bacterium]|jgi:hypothetical protein|nr:hypothetical protein [Mycobacteriales bacterium]
MRRTLAAAAAAVALATPALTPPARASRGGVVVLTCALHYRVWGVGTASGTGECSAESVTAGGSVVTGSVHLSFTVAWSGICPASGALYTGTATGVTNVNFVITRRADTGVVTTTGDVNGAGYAKFLVTSPVGNPCGAPADETVVITIAGA